MYRFISVDSSTKKLAGAYFKNSKLVSVINYNINSVEEQFNLLKKYCMRLRIEKVFLEDQEIYRRETTKDIHKLIAHTCNLQGALSTCFHFKYVERVPVAEWKENLSKKLTKERVLEILSDKEKKTVVFSKEMPKTKQVGKLNKDCIDAIGIGLYEAGRF